jgi:hypothetical protein
MLQRPDQIRRTKALVVTAPLRYGGGSANTNSSAINKQCAFRQVSVPKPPQRKAANRYSQCLDRQARAHFSTCVCPFTLATASQTKELKSPPLQC